MRFLLAMLPVLGNPNFSIAQPVPASDAEACIGGTWEDTNGSIKIEFDEASADTVTGSAQFAGGPSGKINSGSFDGEELSTVILLFDFPDVSEPAVLTQINEKIPKNLQVSLTEPSTLEGTITLSEFEAEEDEGNWSVEIRAHVVTVPIVLQRAKPPVDSIVFKNLEGESIEEVGLDEEFSLQLTMSKSPSECIDRELVQIAVTKDGNAGEPIEIEVIETDALSAVFESETITLRNPEEDT